MGHSVNLKMSAANSRLLALVVDDEEPIRRLTIYALARQGFLCHAATNGLQAEALLQTVDYDVIVTDLRMPLRNGHALAVTLLERSDRPLIFIQTGVIEPRLAEDLLQRGVEDVVNKPADFRLFAVKARVLAEQRKRRHEEEAQETQRRGLAADAVGHEPVVIWPPPPEPEGPLQLPVNRSRPPVAAEPVAAEPGNRILGNLLLTRTYSARELATLIAGDKQLVARVLELANTLFTPHRDRRIESLEEAVSRLGQRCIAELAKSS